jgi:hypothetical protein
MGRISRSIDKLTIRAAGRRLPIDNNDGVAPSNRKVARVCAAEEPMSLESVDVKITAWGTIKTRTP